MKKSIIVRENQCDFCGTCVSVCPVDAIELEESTLRIVESRCTACGFCADVCPFGILEMNP